MKTQNQTIKAIETEYKGYRFRSRLEARWAVFFDSCGVKWEYEPEGFDLGNGLYYLPDFLLHDTYVSRSDDGVQYFGDLWVEVKGKMTETDAEKIIKFSNTPLNKSKSRPAYDRVCANPILVVTHIPEGDSCDDLLWHMFEMKDQSKDPSAFNFETIDHDWFGAFPCINKKKHFTLFGEEGNYQWNIDKEATEKAYRTARQARFEHRH